MILYPTETLYALGVNALDEVELQKLYELKGRESTKVASWLVRDVVDIEQFAELGEVGAMIAQHFMPGSLTLVLPVRDEIPATLVAPDRTIGFRISPDPMARTIINAFMAEYDAPLTCTSANVSGQPSLPTVPEILQQFGEKANMIDEIHDDGPRKGL
jgi:L-threonylcarbamoyladenylate synthase